MKNTPRFLSALNHYAVIFLFIAFVISCCMMLFVSTLTESLGVTLTEENLSAAAKITFINVVLLSLLFTAADGLRRKLMVDRPIRTITEAGQKIAQGDFSVRIPPVRSAHAKANFNEIIDCFNRMAEELSGVETLRTDFIANVSHEMKTPLAVMQNYGTLLQTPELSEEKRLEYAKAVTGGARRLSDLMTNILKLNRLEKQQIYPQTEVFDLSEQLCRSLLQFEAVWETKNIDIETDIAENVLLRADEELLELVWNNLLSNAFKFTEPGGWVSLSLRADDRFAIVNISDTGCGMSPETGAHIFEKFYQGDTSHATAGNGLGLALVKRIMDITGAEISVQSTPGVGSTFTVRLRRQNGEEV